MTNDLIILLASYLLFVELGLAFGYLLKVLDRQQWLQYLIIIIIASTLALLMSRLAAHFFYDTRPYIELHKATIINIAQDNGFPSDHMLAAAVAASVVFLKSRLFGCVLWILAIMVGTGRVLAFAHHPVDIAASAAIAIASTAIAYYASTPLLKIFKRAPKA